jgi:hypothetical protein
MSKNKIHLEKVLAACESLYRLNRVAKVNKPSAPVIYQRKADLIDFLYHAGYCVAAYEHVRTHDNWFDDTEHDERLICFHFLVENLRYCWHTQRVDFLWEPTAKPDTWDERTVSETVIMSQDEISQALHAIEIITDAPSAVEARKFRLEQRRRKYQLAEKALKAKLNRRLAPSGKKLYKDRESICDIYNLFDEQGNIVWQGPLDEFEFEEIA